jgi:hypothetical protein
MSREVDNALQFRIVWKEELEVTSSKGVLVFEITIGQIHVYFPSRDLWLKCAPPWAITQWEFYLDATKAWCKENNIPISVVDNTFMSTREST